MKLPNGQLQSSSATRSTNFGTATFITRGCFTPTSWLQNSWHTWTPTAEVSTRENWYPFLQICWDTTWMWKASPSILTNLRRHSTNWHEQTYQCPTTSSWPVRQRQCLHRVASHTRLMNGKPGQVPTRHGPLEKALQSGPSRLQASVISGRKSDPNYGSCQCSNPRQ